MSELGRKVAPDSGHTGGTCPDCGYLDTQGHAGPDCRWIRAKTLGYNAGFQAGLRKSRLLVEQAHALLNAEHMDWLHSAGGNTQAEPWQAWMRQRKALIAALEEHLR